MTMLDPPDTKCLLCGEEFFIDGAIHVCTWGPHELDEAARIDDLVCPSCGLSRYAEGSSFCSAHIDGSQRAD